MQEKPKITGRRLFDPKTPVVPVPAIITTDGAIKTWSASSLKKFENCPYHIFLQYVKKIPEKENPAAGRGNEIHKLAEEYVKGELAELPKELEKFKTAFEALRAQFTEGNVTCEENWGFTIEWAPTNWTAKDVWGRAKLDAFIRSNDGMSATVIDYKTGRKFGNEIAHTTQGIIYTLAAFMRFPLLEFIKVEFWYLDKAEKLECTFTREQAMVLFLKIHNRATQLTSCTEFRPNPSITNCKWCPYKEHCEWAHTP
jgi:RecB family exonuclease